MFLRTALVPPVTSPDPANAAEASSDVVVAGQDRHRPRPGAVHLHDHPAGAADHVACRGRARRSAPARPAPAPRQTSPAARIRRGTAGCASASARYPAISAGLYGALARSRGSAASAGRQRRDHAAGR